MNVIVSSLVVNYQRSGTGKTILLLHGWGDTNVTFDALVGQLEKKYDVVRPDLPGFGGTQAPAEAWGLDDYADFVAAFVKKLGLKVYALGGHSNGGAISIKAVSTLRLKPKKLLLIASAGIRGRAPFRKLAWSMVAKTGKAVTRPLPQEVRTKLRGKLYGAAGSDMLVAPHMEKTFKRITGEDVQSDAMMLSLPTLIINGSDDTATPLSYAKLFNQAVEGSELFVVEDVGHFVHQQAVDQVVNKIEAFLK